MNREEVRNKFLKFFENRGHKIIPSAPLVPENDPSVLFNTAGMQPLVPYLMGKPHPSGKRLANFQKCLRTGDIDDIGDNTHATFFEMLGNWSLGDYFKEEAIAWSYDFLFSKEEGLGLDKNRLYITVFEGDNNAERDTEAASIWEKVGIPKNRIYFKGADSNWWPAVKGEDTWTGPTGPCTEMFYDITEEGLGDLTPDEYEKADKEQKVVEIWNDVFMQFEKKDGQITGVLSQKNVDTGAGYERLLAVIQNKSSIYDTDLYRDMVVVARKIGKDERSSRIIADHLRASVFLLSDGVRPSNTDQGYILRRLMRRAILNTKRESISTDEFSEFVDAVLRTYSETYSNLEPARNIIIDELNKEETRFIKTLTGGLREFEKIKENVISGKDAFILFTTYGFPIEMTLELAKEKGKEVDKVAFDEEMIRHQDISRSGSEHKFKGGLADTSEKTTMLHTSTHLMLAGLRKYLGEHIHQAGSNITTERTRFDFTHPEKVEKEILEKVESYVNEAISKGCEVVIVPMAKEEAKASGVEGSFWEKYPEVVDVYMVKASDGTIYSKELCGGPHVKNTADIKGKFKITKEESSSAGVRRIKAVLE
jgi:alanyl-tRNA synthetase